ncbi:MAG: hypothetical protein K0S68_1118 [Candidatus Saccharibacteria bacterium]|nr:hypothetical protein [Candidatus Saccharibacteria bacterium]
MSYTLSVDQANALRQIGAWYRSKSSPYLTMGGYAGTGKTTLIAYLRKALPTGGTQWSLNSFPQRWQ